MPVGTVTLAGLSWKHTGASDIHLLPGLVSPELKRLLRAEDQDPATGEVTLKELHNMPGLTITFAGQFNGAPASQGVKLNTSTGEVELTAFTGLRSFLVTATAKQGGAEATARVRVNLHDVLARPPWLTPSPLTVRMGATNMRLSLLAQFHDGVIGDITNWSPFVQPALPLGIDRTYVHATSAPDVPAVRWTAESVPPGGASPITVDPVTGVLAATAETGSAKITARFGGNEASATVDCAKPWSTQVNLTLVSGPGVPAVNQCPNFLFLPEGFQQGDRLKFKQIVDEVVRLLSTQPAVRPFGAFAGRVNYWMGWVPSPVAGVSVLNELDRDRPQTPAGTGSTIELPSPQRPPTTGTWTLEQLINEVGLPVPNGDSGRTIAELLPVWRARYGPHVTEGNLKKDLVTAWLSLADRLLLNERNTAFHIAFGERPALDERIPDRGLARNPRRLHAADFAVFLEALRGPKGEPLGHLWATGKDRDLIVMLCRSARDGGLNDTREGPPRGKLLAVSLAGDLTHRLEVTAAGGWDLRPDPIPRPRELHFNSWMTAAHELAHSWTLGDEYGEFTRPPTPLTITETKEDANLQSRDSLLVSKTGPGGQVTKVLESQNIKWGKWPRIAKAALLLENPRRIDGTNKLRLALFPVPGPVLPAKARFAPGDIVRLRTRPLPTSAGYSKAFRVERIAGLALEVVPVDGIAVDDAFLARFPAKSVVMAPVRESDPDPTHGRYGRPLGLMSDEARARIDHTNNPLNAQPLATEAGPPNDIPNRPCVNVELKVPTSATNTLTRVWLPPPRFPSWVIGLYENGGRHFCGIYRPTGVCIMTATEFRDSGKKLSFYEFCLVCRYAIVDAVDPRLHFEVEGDFVKRYGTGYTELLPD